MTDHEMRVRLAEAMGWTDLDWYSRPGWITGLPPGGRPRDHVPSPLEFDTDAARLRAWCGREKRWTLAMHSYHDVMVFSIYDEEGGFLAQVRAMANDEPDPLRRERLALCRAVVQALGAVEAGGTDE